VSRRVLHSCGLTVVAAASDTPACATAKPWQHHADP